VKRNQYFLTAVKLLRAWILWFTSHEMYCYQILFIRNSSQN
jgi:hypothetical protein